jgi:hypothetical protein
VRVGLVMCLWRNWTVLLRRALPVDLMWHEWVR